MNQDEIVVLLGEIYIVVIFDVTSTPFPRLGDIFVKSSSPIKYLTLLMVTTKICFWSSSAFEQVTFTA